jgi:hypothetical protein
MLYYKEIQMKQSGRKIYKSANGKNIDLDLLISRNELTPAVGNAKVNARGDELGPGGQIVRKKENVLKDYYAQQPGMAEESVLKQAPEVAEEVVVVVVKQETEKSKPTTAQLDKWIEDDDGNFIQDKSKSSTAKKR